MSDNKVQIAPDNTTTGFHSVRTETTTPIGLNGTVVEQQVVTIADDMGNIAAVSGGALSANDTATHVLLRAIILRLDILNQAVDHNYQAPDDYYEDEY